MDFPGNLDVSALNSVYENTLTLAYEATTDAPTPISLTWHPYFTLSGDPACPSTRQMLQIAADHYLPINESRVPTGEIAPVAGTPFDFRKRAERARAAARFASADRAHRRIRPLLGARHGAHAVAAELYSPASGVRMAVKTNLPGLQVYGAYHFRTVYPGLACRLPRTREFSGRAQPREFSQQHPQARRDTPLVHEFHVQRVTT